MLELLGPCICWKGVWNKWGGGGGGEIAQDRLGLWSNAFCPALQYGSPLHSRVCLAWPSSPAVLVVI